MKRKDHWLVLLASAIALVGCAGPSQDPAPSAPGRLSVGKAARTIATCMQQKGWEISADPLRPGSIVLPEGGIPETQVPAYLADEKACRKGTGLDTPPPPPTAEQLKEIYSHQVKTRECLAKYGHIAPEPPSEEAFVAAALANPNSFPYNPWTAVPITLPPEKYQELEIACPQSPPEEH